MYLKSLQITGFKSFALRTALDFEPGLTTIVGPNGCGKSNIADAVRWVLGEQSAKSLRGAKMEDCIFNGSDNRKPLGMAEVSLTLADCEAALETEYNEMTVTRRVFRSGEGQYLINKTLCRLKDVQRLFLGTGIGTSSYSLMEQGKIDRILSSRPEDRREIFEEASGITKFKADKKEAIRKLEHTEANLLRLADVVREVKSQIISLQRQAGKARRYKAMREKLRALDLYATRRRLHTMGTRLHEFDAQLEAQARNIERTEQNLSAAREQNAALRAALSSTERNMTHTMEASVRARTALDRARAVIESNKERTLDLQKLADRDSDEIKNAEQNIDKHKRALQELDAQMNEARGELNQAESALNEETARLNEQEQSIDAARAESQQLREEAVELESRDSHLQNELMQIEARDRAGVVRREHLLAEQAQLKHVCSEYEQRQATMAATHQELDDEVQRGREAVRTLVEREADHTREIDQLRRARSERQESLATRNAQISLVEESETQGEGLPKGTHAILAARDGHGHSDLRVGPETVLGVLADLLTVDPDHRVAVQAVLNDALNALLVSDAGIAIDIIRQLETRHVGAARLFAADIESAPAPLGEGLPGTRLLDVVSCEPAARPLFEQLLHGAMLVRSLDEIPLPVAAGVVYVTPAGLTARQHGDFELRPEDSAVHTPLSRRHALVQWRKEAETLADHLASLKKELTQKIETQQDTDRDLNATRQTLDEKRRALDMHKGKNEIVDKEAGQARERLTTVEWELQTVEKPELDGNRDRPSIARERETTQSRRTEIKRRTDELITELRRHETQRSKLFAEVLKRKGAYAELDQRVQHQAGLADPMETRIQELELFARDRATGLASYGDTIRNLAHSTVDARSQLDTLREETDTHTRALDHVRLNRKQQTTQLVASDEDLAEIQNKLDSLRSTNSELKLGRAEVDMRRQALIERATADYHITAETVEREPEPDEEPDEPPAMETLDIEIAELRAKLDAMGPVNLVAIEEYKEREERYAFLSSQQEDLVKAKDQLLQMIRKINVTTSEMFMETFAQANTNFQEMFKKLFGGGAAKLVLANEEDILECGVEIIARPPGKRLQTVSLLSGGERTLTAVALLFAIYMVKPSPFCVLDELDAALDDSNIGRFVKTLQDFLGQSQFLVITHNRQTIAAANVIYGVTMEERGVSRTVSMKFSEHDKRTVPAKPEPAPVP